MIRAFVLVIVFRCDMMNTGENRGRNETHRVDAVWFGSIRRTEDITTIGMRRGRELDGGPTPIGNTAWHLDHVPMTCLLADESIAIGRKV